VCFCLPSVWCCGVRCDVVLVELWLYKCKVKCSFFCVGSVAQCWVVDECGPVHTYSERFRCCEQVTVLFCGVKISVVGVFLEVKFCVGCCDDVIRCMCMIVLEAELRNNFVLLISELNWPAVAN